MTTTAAQDLQTLKAQETVLLAHMARLDEERAEVTLKLTKCRANLAGVKLGERLAAEAAKMPESSHADSE